jgi:hypothetical protein
MNVAALLAVALVAVFAYRRAHRAHHDTVAAAWASVAVGCILVAFLLVVSYV